MKYKLINKTTGEEHLCEKVVIDGWDYYVNGENIHVGDYYLTFTNKIVMGNVRKCEDSSYNFTHCKKVIATNNPSIDIPKVVDEVELLANEQFEHLGETTVAKGKIKGYVIGYNKSQETHPFTEEDMIEFNEWCSKNYEFDNRCNHWFHGNGYYTTKELLHIWKEQRTKTLYYE